MRKALTPEKALEIGSGLHPEETEYIKRKVKRLAELGLSWENLQQAKTLQNNSHPS